MCRTFLLLFALAGLAGCVATPLPDPPSLQDVYVTPMSIGAFRLDGMPGAVREGDVVSVVDLEGMAPPVRATGDAAGGFTLMVTGLPGDVLRMQLERMGERSEPVDFRGVGGMPTALAPDVACLRVAAAIAFGEVTAGAPHSISIAAQNDCGADVQVATIAFRAPTPGFGVLTTAPLTIAPGASTIQVEVTPPAAGPLEEVLLLRITAPMAGRRAVTLYGSAR